MVMSWACMARAIGWMGLDGAEKIDSTLGSRGGQADVETHCE
jgi:hypothetical protein